METGKTSKYLKYAIGEIILVVIGILIALQLNTWKETIAINKIKEVNLKSLEQDLRDDLNALKSLDSILFSEYREELEKNNRLQQNSATIDTLISISKNEFTPFVTAFDGFNQSTYESLISTGDISLFSDAFKKDLSELAINQDKATRTIQDHFIAYLEITQDHLSQFPVEEVSILYPLAKGPFKEKLWGTINEEKLMMSYNKTMGAKMLYHAHYLGTIRSVLTKTEAILKMFEPIRLPREMAFSFRATATRDAASSGILVPTEIIVIPITRLLIPNSVARLTAPSISNSDPAHSPVPPNTKNKRDFPRGYSTSSSGISSTTATF